MDGHGQVPITREQIEEIKTRIAHGEIERQEPAINRLIDDPIGALRASIGGFPEAGYYLQYRGEPEEILEMLREVLAAAEKELGE